MTNPPPIILRASGALGLFAQVDEVDAENLREWLTEDEVVFSFNPPEAARLVQPGKVVFVFGRRHPRVVADAPPALAPHALDERVIRDLSETRTKGGLTLLQVTAPRVLADTKQLMQTCEESISQHDARTLSQLAHRIKGNCLVIGATEAAGLAQALDDFAQLADLRAAKRALRELENALVRVDAAVLRAIAPASA